MRKFIISFVGATIILLSIQGVVLASASKNHHKNNAHEMRFDKRVQQGLDKCDNSFKINSKEKTFECERPKRTLLSVYLEEDEVWISGEFMILSLFILFIIMLFACTCISCKFMKDDTMLIGKMLENMNKKGGGCCSVKELVGHRKRMLASIVNKLGLGVLISALILYLFLFTAI